MEETSDDVAMSDRDSVFSYTSSVDREFIVKNLHGRIVNNTNDVSRRRRQVNLGLCNGAPQFYVLPGLPTL